MINMVSEIYVLGDMGPMRRCRARFDMSTPSYTQNPGCLVVSPGACNQTVIPALAHAKKLGSTQQSTTTLASSRPIRENGIYIYIYIYIYIDIHRYT